MYNGIGLQSTRGTGTSGHVQRNVAALHRTQRRRTRNPDPNQKLRAALLKKSSDAQRAHEARRRVEVAVAELEEELNARGYDGDTIVSMAQRLREDLLSRGEDEGKGERDRVLEKGHGGRELVDHRNEKLRGLLGVQEGYVEGTAFRNICLREETINVNDNAPNDTPHSETAPKDAASKDDSLQEHTLRDTAPKDATPKDMNDEKGKVAYVPSDTESSSLSESSDESDPDDVPEAQEKAVELATEPKAPSARKESSPEKTDGVRNVDEAEAAGRTRVQPIEPATRESVERNNASSAHPTQRPRIRSSPPRHKEYGRRGRSRTPSPRSEERRRESHYFRESSPRHRDMSPYAADDSSRRRDLSPLRKRGRDRSPYDRNPTSHKYDYDVDGSSPHNYRRSRHHRSSSRRRSRYRTPSRSRSRSRSFSRGRYRRYRDDSPDSLSTSSRSASPYGRRASSPYGRSPSPRKRSSRYSRRPSRRRSPSPNSRKRGYSWCSPSRRVRHRRRSPDEYSYRRFRERRERDRGYSSSESDSSVSPPRYRTPPRRSRFGDYLSSRSPTLSPRGPNRYPASPTN